MDLPKVRWPIEEVSFLKLSLQRESFYEELRLLVDKFIASKELSCDSELLNQVFDYQYSYPLYLDK